MGNACEETHINMEQLTEEICFIRSVGTLRFVLRADPGHQPLNSRYTHLYTLEAFAFIMLSRNASQVLRDIQGYE